jgi:hypothetical protein
LILSSTAVRRLQGLVRALRSGRALPADRFVRRIGNLLQRREPRLTRLQLRDDDDAVLVDDGRQSLRLGDRLIEELLRRFDVALRGLAPAFGDQLVDVLLLGDEFVQASGPTDGSAGFPR